MSADEPSRPLSRFTFDPYDLDIVSRTLGAESGRSIASYLFVSSTPTHIKRRRECDSTTRPDVQAPLDAGMMYVILQDYPTTTSSKSLQFPTRLSLPSMEHLPRICRYRSRDDRGTLGKSGPPS